MTAKCSIFIHQEYSLEGVWVNLEVKVNSLF